ncbi:MAG: hypothetical protein A2806_04105 [Candidatus Terrybacteria bacterium RIFCSPHIGHO2_01_FULL_48_17]|uniref:Nmd3 N-terminal domain-containing protein n=1 Tax=Candidatus Terrybacteria bacterium RIFCSPHIGHO2_01_FULL_48_17 TaxID=1802362 RepID=A0A1G2PMJ1_9BACT|nr:MAG: hypothetical protein A2806_04105 [Candidatus Terrybacteria bacterium RIFCSPHIGHO2_01_FULL_48_17]OHA53742.1 MAG: hypothetical protein A3A30_05230 [Candidatus Terrybacteria bacterium RIFCSPLOWO2_01_FULL_48_14]
MKTQKFSQRGTKTFLRYTPSPRKTEQEFGPGRHEYFVCSDCGAVYFKKSWHHSFRGSNVRGGKHVHFTKCPACAMIANKKFEGEVFIDTSNLSGKMRQELIQHLRHVGERAYARDPMHRIIKLQVQGSKGSIVRVTTTENQLAIRIGREVEKLLKGKGRKRVEFSKEEDVVRVFWKSAR